MKILRLALLALVLPFAASAASVSTNLIDFTFRDTKLSDVAEFLSEMSGLKLLVAENFAEYTVSLEMSKFTPEDALALVALRLACEGENLGWKESPLTDGQKAYVLAEMAPPASKPLGESLKSFKGLARTTIQFRQAQLSAVAAFLQKLTGGALSLVYSPGMAETPVDLKLKDVTPIDALLSMNELFKSMGTSMEWRGVTLPSGRVVCALLDQSALNGPTHDDPIGTARAYFIGDLGSNADATVESVRQLVGTARMEAELNFHEPTQMLVVRAEEETHAFVKNVIEELRRGATRQAPAAPEAK